MFRTLRLTLCWISVLTSIAFAAPPTSIDLHSGWKFRALEASSDHPGMDQWRDAEVPGLVQMDLLRNKQIPDPFYRDNEKSLQWIGLTDWEYRTEFDVDAATLARGHVDLYFAGLDTYADVYLNDAEILKADNMFRSGESPPKTASCRREHLAHCLPFARQADVAEGESHPRPPSNRRTSPDRQRRRHRHRSLHSQSSIPLRMGLGSALRHTRHLAARQSSLPGTIFASTTSISASRAHKDEAELSADFDIVATTSSQVTLSCSARQRHRTSTQLETNLRADLPP